MIFTTLPRLLLLRHHPSPPSPPLLPANHPTSPPTKTLLPPTQLHFILPKLHNNNNNNNAPQHQLLLEEGISSLSDVKKSLKQHPKVLLRTSDEQLASILRLLNSVGITGQRLGQILLQKPGLLRASAENIESKIKFFESLGAQRKYLKLLFVNFPAVVTLSEKQLHEQVQYLRDIGMSVAGITKILCRDPRFFHLHLEDRVKPVVTYLKTCGLQGESLCRAIAARSDIFKLSHLTRSERLRFFQQLGLKEHSRSIARAFLSLSMTGHVTLQARVDFLRSRQFSSKEVAQMVASFPPILAFTEENISKKMDYVVNVLKRDIRELVTCPMFFAYNLETKIMPRFEALAKCKKQELHMIDYSLGTVVGYSEQRFQNLLLKVI